MVSCGVCTLCQLFHNLIIIDEDSGVAVCAGSFSKCSQEHKSNLAVSAQRPGKRKVRRKPLSELYLNGNFTEDREEWQREYRGTAKRWRRRERHKKTELNTSKRKVISNSRMMEEELRLRLTWCYRPEQRCLKTR